jgi:hypothetical protein
MGSFGAPHLRKSTFREGIITGILGACAVALFYLCLDIARGEPLLTPSVLGQAFVLHDPVTPGVVETSAVIAYTIFHFIAFAAFGVVLASLTRAADQSNLARYAEFQVLIVFLVFFYGVVSVASEVVRGTLPFVGVLVANIIAGALMVGYLWRNHPALGRANRTPLGATDGRS